MTKNVFSGLNQTHRKILAIIRKIGAISRVDIAKATELNASVVTRHTRELLDLELIREGERLSGQRGQPAILLGINSDAAYACGVSFQLDRAKFVITNLAGNIIEQSSFAYDRSNVSRSGEMVRRVLNNYLEGHEQVRASFLGVGISLSGYYNPEKRSYTNRRALAEFVGRDLSVEFSATLGHAVVVENDGTAAALGEYYGNSSLKCENMVFMLIGFGIGGGVILGGKPFRGMHGNAGELGWLFPAHSFAQRPSGEDFLETLGPEVDGFAEFERVYEQCAEVRNRVAAWTGRTGYQLQSAALAAIAFLDPEYIVVGGVLPQKILDMIVSAINLESIYKAYPEYPRVRLAAAHHADLSMAIGASYLPFINDGIIA